MCLWDAWQLNGPSGFQDTRCDGRERRHELGVSLAACWSFALREMLLQTSWLNLGRTALVCQYRAHYYCIHIRGLLGQCSGRTDGFGCVSSWQWSASQGAALGQLEPQRHRLVVVHKERTAEYHLGFLFWLKLALRWTQRDSAPHASPPSSQPRSSC